MSEEYEFLSWNTSPDGTGTEYAIGLSNLLVPQDLTLYAQYQYAGDFMYSVGNDDYGNPSVDITDYHGPGGDIQIPAEINGKPVRRVLSLHRDYLFEGDVLNRNVTSVSIPDTVDLIEFTAFAGMSGIQGFEVDDMNSSFADQDGVIFSKDITHLVVFPGGRSGTYTVPSTVTAIEYMAFFGSLLSGVNLPDGLESIWMGAFNECNSLQSLYIPRTVESIWYGAISGAVLQAIDVDPGNAWFSSLDGVLFDKGYRTLMQYPKARTGTFVIPYGTETIDNQAFFKCRLTEISVPSTVTWIGQFAFHYCTGLQTLRFYGDAPTVDEQPWFDQPTLMPNLMVLYRESQAGFGTS